MSTSSPQTFSRRRFVQTTGLAFGATLAGVRNARASFDGLVANMMRESKTAKVRISPLRRNLFVIENTGGNITVLNGPDGKLMIDTGISGGHAQISEALQRIGTAPLKEIVNTHWHFDHTGGNEWLHGTGVRMTAHSNTKKHMMVPTRVAPWKYTFPPTTPVGLPTRLLDKSDVMVMNDSHVAIHHVPHAHTDGDLVVRFQEADVIVAGDTFWNGYYPFVDADSGGDIMGIIKATQENLAAASEKTLIVPGHGPIAHKADLQSYLDMLRTVRDTVARLKRKGMTLDKIIAQKPSRKFDDKWGNYAVAPDDFVRLVYGSPNLEGSQVSYTTEPIIRVDGGGAIA